MQAVTWKDKITDPSNVWLNAMRLEDDGQLSEAALLYLRDAAQSVAQGLGARAALSCSCAANCLERTGKINAARSLYVETAKIYEETANAVFGSSIREALWLLQESHDYYIIGGDAQKAGMIYDKCASLARKSSPFLTAETLENVLRIRRDARARPVSFSLDTQTTDLKSAIDGFLHVRNKLSSKPGSKPRTKAEGGFYRRPSIETNIVS